MGIADWSGISHELQANAQRQLDAANAVSKDLDETRRLLYMALVVNHTKRYNLAGSLINALLHHGEPAGEEAAVIKLVIDAINGDDSTQWIHEQIVRITGQLNQPEAESHAWIFRPPEQGL